MPEQTTPEQEVTSETTTPTIEEPMVVAEPIVEEPQEEAPKPITPSPVDLPVYKAPPFEEPFKEPVAIEFDPEKNHNAISIIKQADGNWKGRMWKLGKLVVVRQGDPHTVLELLITHNGE